MRFALITRSATPTNEALVASSVEGVAWELLRPEEALEELRPGDAALGRLDVLPTLDGVEDGLWVLGTLAARGVRVLNEASSLLAVHDKLLTARLLRRAGLPHPRTLHLRPEREPPALTPPLVVKPRFGSWGCGVSRCESERSLEATLAKLPASPWFARQGALVQELVPPPGYDLRVLIAEGQAVGAVRRVAAPGEWRTNISLGGHREPVPDPPEEACALALAAARASGASLLGVDLLPTPQGTWTVVELNGAVEFTPEYRVSGDVFGAVAAALAQAVLDQNAATEAVSVQV
jgi:RimK family alpha-L-glutamate ligase